MYRTKRSQTVVTEGIFELPNLTIQATRAQTLLLQAIYQSWSHIGNVSSSTVNEALMNEVFPMTGKNTLFIIWKVCCRDEIYPFLLDFLVY
jgi:hypothetical protein